MSISPHRIPSKTTSGSSDLALVVLCRCIAGAALFIKPAVYKTNLMAWAEFDLGQHQLGSNGSETVPDADEEPSAKLHAAS